MKFIYNKNSGNKIIKINGESFHHIFRVRRTRSNEIFRFSNLLDSKIHIYKLMNLDRKSAEFSLDSSDIISQIAPKTHIIQAIIDINEFSKILPALNELNVAKITLFYSDFSQKNQKINLERLNNILIHSCEQCGRLNLMQIELLKDLDSVINAYKNIAALDFGASSNKIEKFSGIIIGAEGGFSNREREILKDKKVALISLNSDLILRATTASLAIASANLEL